MKNLLRVVALVASLATIASASFYFTKQSKMTIAASPETSLPIIISPTLTPADKCIDVIRQIYTGTNFYQDQFSLKPTEIELIVEDRTKVNQYLKAFDELYSRTDACNNVRVNVAVDTGESSRETIVGITRGSEGKAVLLNVEKPN